VLIIALVLAVIGLAALVFAVVTSNALVAWVCIGASVLGVLLLIVDAVADRRRRARGSAEPSDEIEPASAAPSEETEPAPEAASDDAEPAPEADDDDNETAAPATVDTVGDANDDDNSR
jgi:hypothetical protein